MTLPGHPTSQPPGEPERQNVNPAQVTARLLPPRSVLLALGQAHALSAELQHLLWSSHDEQVQSLVAALETLDPQIEQHILQGKNTRLISAWAGTTGRDAAMVETVAHQWGTQPHVALAILNQSPLGIATVYHLLECVNPTVAGRLLRHPSTPEEAKPRLASLYIQGREPLRSNIGEHVTGTLGSDPAIWAEVIEKHTAQHPALLSAVPDNVIAQRYIQELLIEALEQHKHRAKSDPVVHRHVTETLTRLLRQPYRTAGDLEALERIAQTCAAELTSKIRIRRQIDVESLESNGLCPLGACNGGELHVAALTRLIDALTQVDLDTHKVLISAVNHHHALTMSQARKVARSRGRKPEHDLKELEQQGSSHEELAAAARILGAESLSLIDSVDEVTKILAEQGWEPLRYAYRVNDRVREVTWQYYRPTHALLHDSAHYTTSIAHALGQLDPPSLETAMLLLPTWTGNTLELVAAAKVLAPRQSSENSSTNAEKAHGRVRHNDAPSQA